MVQWFFGYQRSEKTLAMKGITKHLFSIITFQQIVRGVHCAHQYFRAKTFPRNYVVMTDQVIKTPPKQFFSNETLCKGENPGIALIICDKSQQNQLNQGASKQLQNNEMGQN